MEGMPEEIEKLWAEGRKWLGAAGAKLVDVSLPHTTYALPAYYIVAPAEASSNLARYDGVRYGLRVEGRDVTEILQHARCGFRTRGEAAGDDRRLCALGRLLRRLLSACPEDADADQARFRECVRGRHRCYPDPATPTAAFGIGEKTTASPIEMYLNDVFTVTVNMAGLPGISVPAGLDRTGLPLGLQLIRAPFDEETLFAAGQVIEEAAGRMALPKVWWERSAPFQGCALRLPHRAEMDAVGHGGIARRPVRGGRYAPRKASRRCARSRPASPPPPWAAGRAGASHDASRAERPIEV